MVLSLRDPVAHSGHQSPKARLVEIVSELSLIRGRTVTLASGARSSFYFDMKPTLFNPEGASIVAELMLREISEKSDANFVGGLEMGAVPIVACISQLSFLKGKKPVKGFFVRKAAKDHGTRKIIEGLADSVSLRRQRVVIVDDVTTSGASVLQAVEAASEAGAIVETVITIVDRLEGASDNLAQRDLKLVALSTARDYGLST